MKKAVVLYLRSGTVSCVKSTQTRCIWYKRPISQPNLDKNMASVEVFCSLLDSAVSDLLCPPSFLPHPPFPRLSPLAVLCVIHYETSPFPLDRDSLQNRHKQAVGSPSSQGLSLCLSVQVPSAAFVLHSLAKTGLWVGGWLGVDTVEGKWLQTALSVAFQSYTFSEVSLYGRNSSPDLIIWPVDVCARVCVWGSVDFMWEMIKAALTEMIHTLCVLCLRVCVLHGCTLLSCARARACAKWWRGG